MIAWEDRSPLPPSFYPAFIAEHDVIWYGISPLTHPQPIRRQGSARSNKDIDTV